jgi:hypothetical protein
MNASHAATFLFPSGCSFISRCADLLGMTTTDKVQFAHLPTYIRWGSKHPNHWELGMSCEPDIIWIRICLAYFFPISVAKHPHSREAGQQTILLLNQQSCTKNSQERSSHSQNNCYTKPNCKTNDSAIPQILISSALKADTWYGKTIHCGCSGKCWVRATEDSTLQIISKVPAKLTTF